MISDDILCQNFKAYMLLERGYSENTRIAYLSDLVRLHQWLAEGGYTLTMATPEVLADFVFQIHDIGVSQRTQARIVAGVKAFYHYLKLEHLISEDPSMLLERPAIGRSLPEVLSVEEIDAMCATFDVADPLGVRNRAILETLYGSGLRVSELCMLEERLVNIADRFLIVSGKGNKERMVPMSDTAVRWIEEYIAVRDSSYSAVKPGNEAYLFFQPARSASESCNGFLYCPRRRRSSRSHKNNLAAYHAAFLRHTHARGRREPSCHSADARTHKHRNHRNVSAHGHNPAA